MEEEGYTGKEELMHTSAEAYCLGLDFALGVWEGEGVVLDGLSELNVSMLIMIDDGFCPFFPSCQNCPVDF